MSEDSKTFGRRLRELGEGLDGFRDQEMRLVKRKLRTARNLAPRFELVLLPASSAHRSGDTVLWKFDANTVTDIPNPERIDIVYQGEVVASCEEPTDALFWTDSSIEKFVYGYYEQVRVFPRLYRLLRAQLEDPARRRLIIAVKHDHPSHIDAITLPGDGSDSPVDEESISASLRLLVVDPAMRLLNSNSPWFTPWEFEAGYEAVYATKSVSNVKKAADNPKSKAVTSASGAGQKTAKMAKRKQAKTRKADA